MHRISFEENDERLKVTIPLQRQWFFWLSYTAMLLLWLGATGWGVATLWGIFQTGNFGFEGLYLLAWFAILLLIALGWWYLGSQVWRRWQYYTATREILFFYKDSLVVRRPLSLLGVTDGYAWAHVSPFQFDTKYNSVAFDYGSQRIPIGLTLPLAEAQALLGELNGRFFPHYEPQD
jgi:hypothetical protein